MATHRETETDAPATTHRVRLTLRLDGTDYSVRPIPPRDLGPDVVRAFLLVRRDAKLGRVRHTVRETILGQFCSCGDQTYRRGPTGDACKHIAACRACGLL